MRKLSLNAISLFQDYETIGLPSKAFMILSLQQINGTGLDSLLYNSVCLIVVAAAQNRGQLEEQLALGRSLQFKKGKLSMIIMSENKLDLVNVTKVPFPTMLLEAGTDNPREQFEKLRRYLNDLFNLTTTGSFARLLASLSLC